LTVAVSLAAAGAWAQAVPVIFDTDMGNDVDDALALAMLHALESRGECRLRANMGLSNCRLGRTRLAGEKIR